MIHALGIDVGGTGVKLGLVDSSGQIRSVHYVPVETTISLSQLVDRLSVACQPLLLEVDIEGIGIAMPGFADSQTGILRDGGNNLPCLTEQSLPQALAARLNRPVRFENDGLAAVLGEMRFGAARGACNFGMLTLGTGVGGGIVTGGRLVRGKHGEPPELGAMVLDMHGTANYSGLAGTLEGFAGKAGFLAAFQAHGRSGDDLRSHFNALDSDPAARAAFNAVATRIAQACGTLVNSLNLDLLLLGGGIAGVGDRLLRAVRSSMTRSTWPMLLGQVELRLAERGNDAGMLGAASLFFPSKVPEKVEN